MMKCNWRFTEKKVCPCHTQVAEGISDTRKKIHFQANGKHLWRCWKETFPQHQAAMAEFRIWDPTFNKNQPNQLNPEKKHFFVHRPFLQSLQCFLLDFQVMNSKYNNGGMLKSVISCPCQTNWISIWHTAQHPAIWQTYLERYKAVSNSRRQDIHWMKNMFCWAGKERGGHDSKLCWLNFYIKLSWQQKLPEEK